MKKIGIIFNQDAGSYKKLTRDPAEWVAAISAKHELDGVEFDVRAVPAREINDSIREFIEKRYDVITASGGDGTINGVASMIRDTDAVLGVIPSGTFNNFAKAAGIPLDFEKAVLNLAKGKVVKIDYGSLNERMFLNNSGIGQYPIVALTRETGRRWNPMNKRLAFLFAAVKTAARYPVIRISVESGPECVKTPLLFIGNNYYDIAPLRIGKRKSLTGGKLYAYGSTCTNLRCSLRLAVMVLFNRIKLSSHFDLIEFEEAVIHSERKILPVSVDGEIYKLKTPLHYKMHAKGLKVVLPE